MRVRSERRLRVLLSAYACAPHEGSEPEVGWGIASELSKRHEVWVATRSDHRAAIEAELARNPNPNLRFVYVRLPFETRRWYRGLRLQAHYYLWQLAAYRSALRLHKKVLFDIAHHVTYVRYWSPSGLALLPIPFIFGPVAGAEAGPPAFWRDFGWRGRVHEIARIAVRHAAELDPLVRMTARRAAISLSATCETTAALHRIGASEVRQCFSIALGTEDLHRLRSLPPPRSTTFRFVSICELLHWKGVHLGLRGFAASGTAAEYWVLGNGPELGRLKRLAADLGIEGRVTFFGLVPRAEVFDRFRDCHVLVHPSLHDSGGFVCAEAMAAGRPVLCLDLGGPAAQVTADTGIKVPGRNPEQAVAELARAMRRLVSDPALVHRMGDAGRRRTAEFEWQKKCEVFDACYAELCGLDDSASEPG